MSVFDEILQKNKRYLKKHASLEKVPLLPRKKLAVLTCVDLRLQGVLEKAMGLQQGDAVFIRTAGNNLNYGEIRSVITAVFKYDIRFLLVVGHEDCGMGRCEEYKLQEIMLERGITKDALAEYDDLDIWLGCFQDEKENVRETVRKLSSYSLTPPDLEIRGVFFSLSTGELAPVEEL
jgi:carbonic anhydrase